MRTITLYFDDWPCMSANRCAFEAPVSGLSAEMRAAGARRWKLTFELPDEVPVVATVVDEVKP